MKDLTTIPAYFEFELSQAQGAIEPIEAAFSTQVEAVYEQLFTKFNGLPLFKRAAILALNHQHYVFTQHGGAVRLVNATLAIRRELAAYTSGTVEELRAAITKNFLPSGYFLHLFNHAEDADASFVLFHELRQYLSETKMRLPENLRNFMCEHNRLGKISATY